MKLIPTWLEGAPPGPPGPNISSPCGSYTPHTQGLVTFPTQLFNLLSGEVGAMVPRGTFSLLKLGVLNDLVQDTQLQIFDSIQPHSHPCAFPFPGLPRVVPFVLWVLPTPIEPGRHLPVLRLCHQPHLLAVHPTSVSDIHILILIGRGNWR